MTFPSCSRLFPSSRPAAGPLGLAALVLVILALPALDPIPARAMDRLHYQAFPGLEGKIVEQVLFLGNNRTREVVFRREMGITEGALFRSDDLWRDWERLVDLGIFANVEVDAVPSGGGVLVVISVHERPRWLVTPVVDYDLSDREITVGYRLRVRNIRGLNHEFRSRGRIGARDNLNFSWTTPWIGPRRQVLSVGLNIDLPQAGVDELRSNRVFLGTTQFLGDYKKLRQGISAFTRVEILKRDDTYPGGGVDQLSPAIGVGYFRDSRDVRVDPVRGSLLAASTEYVGAWTTSDISYLRSAGEGRAFLRLGKGIVVAARAVSILTIGEIPDYRKLGVGGSASIRGQRPDVVVGNNVGRASLEVRFPLLRKRRFNLPIPFVPGKIRNFDLRVDGEVFTDVGSAWDDSVGLQKAEWKEGFGIGLRIFLPVFEIARLELAFDPDGNPTLYLREGNLI